MGNIDKIHIAISSLYWFLCIAGFTYQTYNIAYYYFQYGTDSELLITIPTSVPVPNFVICFRYADIIDVKLLQKKYSKVKLKLEPSSIEEVKMIQNLVSVSDIFMFTPAVVSTITKCSIKNPSDLQFKEGSNSLFCNKYFFGKKFYLQEYMCYDFSRSEGSYVDNADQKPGNSTISDVKADGKEETGIVTKSSISEGSGDKNISSADPSLSPREANNGSELKEPTTSCPMNVTLDIPDEAGVVATRNSTKAGLNDGNVNESNVTPLEYTSSNSTTGYKDLTSTRKDRMTFSYRSIAYALDRPGVMYSITFDGSNLVKVKFLKAVIVPSGMSPVQSIQLTTVMDRNYDSKTKKANFSFFQSTYSVLQITKLQSPYDTDCVKYSIQTEFESQSDCRRICNTNRTLAGFSKVPFSVATTNNSIDPTIRHVTNEDLENNESMNKELITIESTCKLICRKPDCDDQFSLTKTEKEESKNKSSSSLTFEVSVPRKPDFSIVHRERITWNEFLVYVLSCFGIWFGLSVLSVNPFNLIDEKNEENKARLLHADSSSESEEQTSDYDGNERSSRREFLFCSEVRNKLRREMNREIAMAARAIYQSREWKGN